MNLLLLLRGECMDSLSWTLNGESRVDAACTRILLEGLEVPWISILRATPQRCRRQRWLISPSMAGGPAPYRQRRRVWNHAVPCSRLAVRWTLWNFIVCSRTSHSRKSGLSGSLAILNSDLWAGFRPIFGQTWPQNTSRTTGLVLQCRLHQKSAPQANSISWQF